ncbi:MAG TPA: T9SS type A sorting domain-containing protein [Flavisolibacter sp.]|nr:T9SS type A sorting domain-containing protein [Flavisolibacter sp.]
MKCLFLPALLLLFAAGTAIGQVEQNFNTTPDLHSLTLKCWQFSGTSLQSSTAANEKYLSLTTPTGTASSWFQTPFMQLNGSKKISFTYQLANALPNGATRTVSVKLLGPDGKQTVVKEWLLDERTDTKSKNFTAIASATEAQRLLIEVAANGSQTTSLYIDNLKMEASFNNQPPYSCQEGPGGVASIHYLKTFKGQLSDNRVQLQWTVVENENNGHFEVEHSTDGRNFTSVATIKATTRVAVEDYQYQQTVTGSAYYRLKLVSKSGVRMYSDVLFFKAATAAEGLQLLQNPVRHTVKLGFYASEKATASFSLYNTNGTKLLEQRFAVQKGYCQATFPLPAQVTTGIYLAEVICGGQRLTGKILKE